ncbi:MAG: MGMT family protein [Tepidisphaeraceae bacterium]|jgi:methylated-DNA-[protein]-cysteine S-methyltransferase
MNATTSNLESKIRSGRVIAGMSFQQKVWAVTAGIPRGRVMTYADVARRLKTAAYRAVGRALHVNPYAPQVPCHRVVGSDGRLTGYAGGLPAKRRLLESEGIHFVGSRVDLRRCRVVG